MKKIIIAVLLLLTLGITVSAQCTKKVKWISAKTERLDSAGNVMQSKDETVTVETSETNITLVPEENPGDSMTGAIKEKTCAWRESYKNGKTVIKSEMADARGDTKNITMTIEAKDGSITIVVELEEMPGLKIKLYPEKYEEE